MTYHTTARAHARALALGLAIGAAGGLAMGSAYVAGRPAPAAKARGATAPAARVAPVLTVSAASVTPISVTRVSSTPAQPFRLAQGPMFNSDRDLDCLADAVYYEARGETPAGQAAIAQVVLNRVRHPAFPKSVCAVVFQGVDTGDDCQFSFACNGAMHRPKDGAAWARAEQVAARALAGFVMPQVGEATHFHAAGVEPGWGPSLMRVAQVGLHVFYRFGGHESDGPSSARAAQPSTPANQPAQTVFASMLPGLNGDLTAGPSSANTPPAAPKPAIPAAPDVQAAASKAAADTAATQPATSAL